jgi:hypothetical protein
MTTSGLGVMVATEGFGTAADKTFDLFGLYVESK